MRIGLIDVDSHNFPNLCLMKLSEYHTRRGDRVEWWDTAKQYDLVYKSRVFTDTYSKDTIQVNNADKVIQGGTGYGLGENLPHEIEHIRPDYFLYPRFLGTAYGFLSRGCPRNCGFCIVSKKEGRRSVRVADLSEFWNGEEEIKLMDPNLLACPDHERLIEQLIESRALVDFTQGLDIRLISRDNVSLLNKVRTKAVYFAWDNPDEDLTEYFRRFRELTSIKSDRNRRVYVLTNYGSTHEQDLYRVNTLRALGYESVTATFDCGGHTFTAKGKQVLSQGWRAIQEVFRSSLKEKPEDEDAEGVLPALTEGQVFEPVSASVTEHFTSPPKPYTEDTLLSAMENAGKEDIPEDAERRGLGTPATRAAIIEKLVSGGFVERKGKNLIPTKAGVNLVTVLPELLTSPKLTADWEQRLNEVAKGQASPEDFMDGIEAMAAELVRKYSHISEDGQKLFQPEKETVGLCPRCGKPVYEGKKNFACSDRACQFVMWKNDRFWTSRRKEMTPKMAADLLKKGRTSVKGMWSEKKGSTYDAVVILDDTGGKYVNFKLEFPKRKDGVHGKK